MRKEIINELAEEFGIQPHIIEKMVKSQFGFVASVMREKKLEPIRLHHLGVFAIKPSRLQYLIGKGWIEDTSL